MRSTSEEVRRMPLYNNVVKQGALLNGKKAPIVKAQTKKHHQQADVLADCNLTPEELELSARLNARKLSSTNSAVKLLAKPRLKPSKLKTKPTRLVLKVGKKRAMRLVTRRD